MTMPITGLPFALLAFAVGATSLQWMAELPAPQLRAGLLVAVGAGLFAAAVAARIAGRRAAPAFAAVVPGCMACALFAAGFVYAAWRADLRLGDALPPDLEGADIVVVGVIDDLPQPSTRGTRFTLAVEQVESPGGVVPTRLALTWYAREQDGGLAAVPALAAGARWQLVVRLKRPHGTVNPHGFDFEAWLLQNDLRATGYVRQDARNRCVSAFAGRWRDYVPLARESLRHRIHAALPDAPYAGVIAALAIGDQRAIPESQWRIFNRTGIAHLISISGLHVTVFAALAGALAFGVARRSVRLTTRMPARRIAVAVGFVAAAAYVLVAGVQIPAVRTLLMLAVAAAGIWVARPGTAALAWLWALALVVAWDPWAGLTPGFWLSFGAVGLLLYAHAGRLSAPPPAARRGRAGRALAAAARAQTLIFVGLVPMTLALFQQVSVVAPVANALAIPVVTFGVVPLALAGMVLPGAWCWPLAHAVLAILMRMLEALAAMPAAVWEQHAPPLWAVAVALIGVAWVAAPRAVPGRWLGLICMLPLAVVRPPPPATGTMRMVVLDVDQGLAVVVQTATHALLYDAGPRYTEDADAGGRIVVPYLRATGIARLDGLVVSHQDSDHSGGAGTLLQTVPVDWFASSLPADNALVASMREHGAAIRCEAGQRWSWDGIRFSVLHPAPAHYRNPKLSPNDVSCVVRVDSAYGSALLTGDLEARGEDELVHRDAAALKADVLVVPHHGSRTSSTAAFIAAVAPAVAVFTPGYRNRFGHPRPDVVARYAAAGVARYRTDHDGALSFTFAPGSRFVPVSERERDRRYWRDPPAREATMLD
jgi:competence protein ComEC